MTDLELIELASKASGFEYTKDQNPLESDSLALRLAVKLRLDIDNGSPSDGNRYVCAYRCGIAMVRDPVSEIEEIEDECQRLAATRRAIVRAAASIGAAIGEKAR